MVWTNTSLQEVGRTKTPLGGRSSVQKVGVKNPDKAWPPKMNFQKSPEITFLDIISQPPGQVSSFLIKRISSIVDNMEKVAKTVDTNFYNQIKALESEECKNRSWNGKENADTANPVRMDSQRQKKVHEIIDIMDKDKDNMVLVSDFLKPASRFDVAKEKRAEEKHKQKPKLKLKPKSKPQQLENAAPNSVDTKKPKRKVVKE